MVEFKQLELPCHPRWLVESIITVTKMRLLQEALRAFVPYTQPPLIVESAECGSKRSRSVSYLQ